MLPMELALRRAGYGTLAITYPSRRHDIVWLAGFVARTISEVWDGANRVHVVTHSMGGLVAARFLSDFAGGIPKQKLGRVVMLAPPLQGSEVADFLQRFSPYRWFYGPAGQELTTTRESLDAPLPYELGIIAGSRGWPYLVAARVIPRPHDGRVAVARTMTTGMADHLVVPSTHTFIAWNPLVQRNVVHFLQHGRFGAR